MNTPIQQVTKALTPNDVGTTGSHQAGITIPKTGDMLEFFPALDGTVYNPRARLHAFDVAHQLDFPLTYVYYNGKLHARSTRNEFRLTGLSAYFVRNGAEAGDILTIRRLRDLDYELSLSKTASQKSAVFEERSSFTITLSGQWSTYRKR